MTGPRAQFRNRVGSIVLGLLLLGAVVNLVAGVRRPLRERALVHQSYYREAQEAARAVQAQIPAGSTLGLMVYDGDQVGGMDGGGFAEDYFNWLLYPRALSVYRVSPTGQIRAVKGSGQQTGPALWFRVQGSPDLPHPTGRILAQGDSWVLTEGERR